MPEKKSTNLFDFRTLDQIPTGKIGDPITAEWLNRGIEGVNRLTGNVDRAQQFIRPPTGRGDTGITRVVSVVLLGLPSATSGAMLVRRVKYADSPPELVSVPRYEWLGDVFTAYMEFGRVRQEYTSLLSGPSTPTVDTTFLQAKLEGEFWFVGVPPAAEERVVAVGIRSPFDDAPGGTRAFTVGRIKWESFPPGFPDVGPPTPLAWLGDTFLAYVDFGNRPEQYVDMVHIGDVPNSDKPILTARKEGPNWFLELPKAKRLTQFRVGENFGDYVSAFQSFGGIVVPDTFTLIAKRWLLRRTPFHGNTIDGIEYTYENAYTRIAENSTEDKERQFITPPYNPAALIYATQDPLHGTDVVTERAHGDIPAGTAVTWLAEVDGREWAWDGEDINP
jgi:hypothetical protein